KDMDTGLSELDEKRFLATLNKVLKTRGYKTSVQPDFKVNFYSSIYEKEHHNNLNIGIGTIGGHVGGNIAGGIPIKSSTKMLSITVEFVDAQTNTLFWQGVVEGKLNTIRTPADRRKLFEKMTRKLLKDY